ncbi:hypothetical protein MKX01_004083 [Papaver californicum]|nr:hypothetical protein MKX01_031509 [Papaver californicum]KAI3995471.1 hypothetical protein MKX01_004083 [Papaver californicum]
MAFLIFLLILLSLLFLCISFYFILIHYYNSFNLKKQGLPPGNLGLPIIGESLQLISAYKTENPEPFIDSRVYRFGKIFTTHVFGETTVFSTEYEVNRFILMNEGKLFECSYTSSISNLLGRKSLLLLKGNLHKKMHSLTKNFISNSSNVRDHLFSDINRIIQFNLDSWSNKVFLLDQTKKITFELIVKQLMSIDPTGVDQEWTESLRKHYLILIDGFFSVPILFLFTPYYNAIHARKKVEEEIRVKVRERKREKEMMMMTESDDHDEEKKDMLGMLLDVMVGKRGEDHQGSSVGINDSSDQDQDQQEKKVADNELEDEEEIVDFLLSLILGGYETTSTSMTLAVKFLTETPLALAQLKEEHEQIKNAKKEEKDGKLEWSDYKYNMPFTQCVINETLRVANIVSGVFRRAMTDVNIKGYTIPKGCKVFTSFRAVHLNQDHFKEATSFNPWRWQQKRGDTDQVVGPSKMMLNLFTPFGGGPRLCPGYELARVEISVFLHHLVTTFSWAPAEEDKLVFFPTTRTLKRYPIYLKRLM